MQDFIKKSELLCKTKHASVSCCQFENSISLNNHHIGFHTSDTSCVVHCKQCRANWPKAAPCLCTNENTWGLQDVSIM